MTAEEDARQDVLDAVERLRGPASLLPAVRVQRQYDFERLLDVFVETVVESSYNDGVSDGKSDGKDIGYDEGMEVGRTDGAGGG